MINSTSLNEAHYCMPALPEVLTSSLLYLRCKG
jgi:hypothetical protein